MLAGIERSPCPGTVSVRRGRHHHQSHVVVGQQVVGVGVRGYVTEGRAGHRDAGRVEVTDGGQRQAGYRSSGQRVLVSDRAVADHAHADVAGSSGGARGRGDVAQEAQQPAPAPCRRVDVGQHCADPCARPIGDDREVAEADVGSGQRGDVVGNLLGKQQSSVDQQVVQEAWVDPGFRSSAHLVAWRPGVGQQAGQCQEGWPGNIRIFLSPDEQTYFTAHRFAQFDVEGRVGPGQRLRQVFEVVGMAKVMA